MNRRSYITAILVALLIAFCGAGLHAATGNPVEREIPYVAGHTLNADFDGDNEPDIAIGRPNGESYTVEIRFTTRVPNAFLTLTPSHLGLQLIAYDVDKDNFPDLVITSPVSILPVAVWLGDGKGHFRQGNPWAYLPFHWDTPFRYAPDKSHDSNTGVIQNKRLSYEGVLDLPAERNAEAAERVPSQSPRIYSLLFVCDLSARSPPRSTPL